MAGTPSGVTSGQDCSQEQKRPPEGPRCVALARGPLVLTSKPTEVNLGSRGVSGDPSRMGTVPSLSSWATSVPEQSPAGQRP